MAEFNAAFWEWFAGSRVVDSHGDPLVVYHWTAEPFHAFKKHAGMTPRGALFFSTDPTAYSDQWGDRRINAYLRVERPFTVEDRHAVESVSAIIDWGKMTEEVDAMAQLGYDRIDVERLWYEGWWTSLETESSIKAMRALGYDGFFFHEQGQGFEIAVFEPSQIKSATGNDGTWDADDPDIRSNPGGKRVSPAEVVEALERADSTGDEGWVGMLVDRVLEYSEWKLVAIDPRKTVNFYLAESEGDENGLADMGMVLNDLPPIVVIPAKGNRGKYEIIDGSHRAAAAITIGQKTIRAYVPA